MTLAELTSLASNLLKDKADLNRLKGFEPEFSEGIVRSASKLALLTINNKYACKTSHTIGDCPEYLLLLGVAAQLLESEIILKSRNTLAINDGGIAVNREGNLGLYKDIWASLKQEFETELDAYKSNLNFMTAW
jgi:hypothetical protein